jgi:hypothetical protein
MLLLRLEIIATTYRSTIFKTDVFSLYLSVNLYSDASTHAISVLVAGGA